MTRTARRRATAVLALASLAASCATTQLAPISASGSSFAPLKDERELWQRAREEERQLRSQVTVYQDPELDRYLGRIVTRLTPPAMAANPEVRYRVTVIEDPTLNAFSYPHGSIYVHTGLLARLGSEDELATVLGHEMSHVEGRHMLRWERAARNRSIGFSIAAVAGAVLLSVEAGEAAEHGHYGRAAGYDLLADVLVGLGLQLAVVAAVNGYGRELEWEADRGALEKMTVAGYDVHQAPEMFAALLDDRGEPPGSLEQYFFGSHPRLENRLAEARGWIAKRPSGAARPAAPELDRAAFARLLRPVVRDDARLNVDLGRLHLAESELARALALDPGDAETEHQVGRLRLAQAAAESDPGRAAGARQAAERAFLEAVRLDADLPGPHRELGLLADARGDAATACRELGFYLELARGADDAPALAERVRELDQEGACRPSSGEAVPRAGSAPPR